MSCPNVRLISLVIEWIDNNDAILMSAPCEAEWKCVFLERTKIVGALMSADGDCVLLGVNSLHYNVNFYQ